MDKSLKYYLAGPMSGIPQFNIPLFDQVTAVLRGQGYTIVSPAERDTYETRLGALASDSGSHADLAIAETYGDMLARDMKILADEVDGIILLPSWHKSRGARTEAYIGLIVGNTAFGAYRAGFVTPLSNEFVAGVIADGLTDQFDGT